MANQYLIPLLVAFAILCVTAVTAYNTAFKGGRWTCNRFILNTYLYVLLALVIVAVETLFFEWKTKGKPMHPGLWSLLILLSSFGFLFAIFWTKPEHVGLMHLFWLGFLLTLGLSFYYNYLEMKGRHIIISTLLTVMFIVVGLSLVAFWKPELISLTWGPVLLVLLSAGIILRLVLMFTNTGTDPSPLSMALSYGFILLFSFYVLYDTKVIQVMAKRCKEGHANYILSSMGVFLDILNLIQDVSRVNR